MAKIKKIELINLPETVNVGDDFSDVTIESTLEFHSLDLKLSMEYQLLHFIYDVHGIEDVPIMIANWDESNITTMSTDRKDIFLGTSRQLIIPESEIMNFRSQVSLKLGLLKERSSYYAKRLEVYAALVPAISFSGKWSQSYETKLIM